jgi:hypothetical protein
MIFVAYFNLDRFTSPFIFLDATAARNRPLEVLEVVLHFISSARRPSEGRTPLWICSILR